MFSQCTKVKTNFAPEIASIFPQKTKEERKKSKRNNNKIKQNQKRKKKRYKWISCKNQPGQAQDVGWADDVMLSANKTLALTIKTDGTEKVEPFVAS